MEYEKKITVTYQDLQEALEKEYNEDFDIIDICFDNYVDNDCYKSWYFDGEETFAGDEYCSDERSNQLNLLDRFLHKEFPNEEYILIEICC